MALIDIGTKFRQSKDYDHAMLIRDLIEYTKEINDLIKALQTADTGYDTRLDSLEAKFTEEGTWTPNLKFGGNSVGMTYQTQLGRWQKRGKLVFLDMEIRLTAKGSSVGACTVLGLPFANTADRPLCMAVGYYDTMTLPASSTMSILGYANDAGLGLPIRYSTNTGTTTAQDTHFSNTSRIIASGCYVAAS